MMNDEIRSLCETLRAQGVKRAELDRESGRVTVVEFFEAAPGLPTTAESESGAQRSEFAGFERALAIARTGKDPSAVATVEGA